MKECNFCKNNKRILPSEWKLNDLMKLHIERVDDSRNKFGMKNIKNTRFVLNKCKKCGTFWELRPLYEETMFGGEPEELIKISNEYVKEYYPDVKI